jgi:hypothetical protein
MLGGLLCRLAVFRLTGTCARRRTCAPCAPTLNDAVETVWAKAYVIMDGTVLPIDQIAADRPNYAGEHK